MTVNQLTAGFNTTNQGTSGAPYVTASISPTSGATLVLVHTSQRSTAAQSPDTVTGLSGTWSKLAESGAYNGGLSMSSVWRCTDWSGSGTVTITFPNTQSCCMWEVFEILGNNQSTPTNVKVGTGTGTTASLTLDSSPAGTSFVFGGVGTFDIETSDIQPGAQFTEIGDSGTTGIGGSDSGEAEAEYDGSSPGTGVDWSWTGTRDWGGIAWEELDSGAAAADFGVPAEAPQGQVLQGMVF